MLFKNNSHVHFLLPPNTVFAPTEAVANRIDFLFFHYGDGLVFIFGTRLKTLYELKFNGHVTDAQGCITG